MVKEKPSTVFRKNKNEQFQTGNTDLQLQPALNYKKLKMPFMNSKMIS
jgi:hypothetical protein